MRRPCDLFAIALALLLLWLANGAANHARPRPAKPIVALEAAL